MAIIIGVLLEILAAALGTLSKQLIAISEHLKKPWIFHIGATINIAVGPIVDASAYAFAPQVIIAPFACLDVIFNALTAPYTLRWQNEILTRAHFLGCAFVTIGAGMTSFFADVENEVFDVYMLEAQLLRWQSITYFSIELAWLLAANFMLRRGLMSPMFRGIALGVIAGVLMGNVFFVKAIVTLIRHSISTGETDAWLRPTPYCCIACAAGGAVVGHLFMRKGLGEYKGVFMVTIFEGAHISAACLSGCIVMSEMSGAPWWRYVCYWASVFLIVAGMLFINSAAADSQMGKQVHIAQHFVDEESENLKDGVAPAPIGKTLSEAEMDLELVDRFGNARSRGFSLDGDGSPIGGAPIGYPPIDIKIEGFSANSTPNQSPQKTRGEGGETSSNVSTSTPEADMFEMGNDNGRDIPVFSGVYDKSQ